MLVFTALNVATLPSIANTATVLDAQHIMPAIMQWNSDKVWAIRGQARGTLIHSVRATYQRQDKSPDFLLICNDCP
jgi:hypothetical protein